MLKQLIQENQGCQFPCWCGFTPGQTAWKTTLDFIQSSGLRVSFSSRKDETAVYIVRDPNPESVDALYQRFVVEKETVIKIQAMTTLEQSKNSAFGEIWRPYLLPAILTQYGEPKEVRLLVFGSGPGPDILYYLLLFYPDQGFLAYYKGEGARAGDNLRIYPTQSSFILMMWPTGKYQQLEQAILQPNPNFHPAEDHRPIQEVSDMSVEDFYARFKNAGNQTCFETPSTLW